MRAVALAVAVVGCGDPISNAVFYEEAAYLDALPTSARFAAPAAFLEVEGSDPVLLAAREAARELSDLYVPMTLCGEALEATEPDVRGDTFRTWDLVPVVIVTMDGTLDWWVRGTVTSTGEGAWTWTMEGARNRVGPWGELSSGRHEASGAGYVSWRLDRVGALLGVDLPWALEHLYAKQPDGAIAVETRLFSDPLSADPLRYWAASGDAWLSWSGAFTVTDDAATWPGVAVAVHTSAGGRADGVVWTGEEATQVAFGACWNEAGDNVWSGGADAAVASGDPSGCVLDSLLEP